MSLLGVVRKYDIKEWEELDMFVPGFDYHRISTKIIDPKNIVGHQQRSFIIYWAVKEHERTGGIGLEPGCGQLISPYCIGTDYYAGTNHPQYGGIYRPHVRCLGENLPFGNDMFDFIVSHHSLEHMNNLVSTLKEWVRILKKGGKIAIVVPDKKFGPFLDHGHVSECTPEEFRNILVHIPNIKLLEIDTFNNGFSFNILLEKI